LTVTCGEAVAVAVVLPVVLFVPEPGEELLASLAPFELAFGVVEVEEPAIVMGMITLGK